MRSFHKPVHRPSDVLELFSGADDPAERRSVAHATAGALLSRVRSGSDPAVVDRLVSYCDEHGVDDVAELWSDADAVSLPGAMWRLHLLRHVILTDAQVSGYQFNRGLEVDGEVNHAIVGGTSAPSPQEVVDLVTEIFKGAFTGDFALALERASAFSQIMAAGVEDLADSDVDSERSTRDHSRQEAFAATATELRASARAWRDGRLH